MAVCDKRNAACAAEKWRRRFEAERKALKELSADFVSMVCKWYVDSQAVEYDAGNANYGLAVCDARRLTDSIKAALDRWTDNRGRTDLKNK